MSELYTLVNVNPVPDNPRRISCQITVLGGCHYVNNVVASKEPMKTEADNIEDNVRNCPARGIAIILATREVVHLSHCPDELYHNKVKYHYAGVSDGIAFYSLNK